MKKFVDVFYYSPSGMVLAEQYGPVYTTSNWSFEPQYYVRLEDYSEKKRAAVASEREACASMLDMTTGEILLMAGEMTAQELRTVKSVLRQRSQAIRARSVLSGAAPQQPKRHADEPRPPRTRG